MRNRAFTLIELLVVISIIALLASVVLSTLNAAREKGRLAGAKQFFANVEHVASDSAVGIWEFDECSGIVVNDRSGNGNNGSFLGTMGTSSWSTDTPFGTGCSLAFTGTSGSYVSIPDSSTVSVTSPYTLSAWIKTNSNSTQQGIIEKYDTSNKGYTIRIVSSGKMFASSANDTPAGPPLLTGNAVITTGVWHHVASVYDGTTLRIYIDGTLDSSLTGGTVPTDGTQTLKIGARGDDGTNAFNGLIDRPRIFAKALTASEVGALYASDRSIMKVAER